MTRFVRLLDLFWGMGEVDEPIKWHVPVFFGGDFVGRFKCIKMGRPSKQKVLYKKFHGTLNV